MEITYRNRPMRIAYLLEDYAGGSVPREVNRLRNLPSEQVIFSFIPVNRGVVEEAFLDFLAHFDPDFVLFPGDSSVDHRIFEERTSPFNVMSMDSFFFNYQSLIVNHWGVRMDEETPDEEVDTSEVLASLPDILNDAAQLFSEEVTVIYPEPDNILDRGSFVIPGAIMGMDIIDVIITDNEGGKNAYRIPATRSFRRIIREANPAFPIRITLPSRSGVFSLLPVTPFGDVSSNVFHLPPRDNVLVQIFQDLGYAVRPTHNVSLMQLFKNLEAAARFFMNPFALPLITHFASGGSKPFGAVRKIISHSSSESAESPDISEKLLDLLRWRILLRGYLLSCDFCNTTDFYAMKEVDEVFTCHGCHRENLAPLKLNPAFKLNQIVLEGYKQGTAATILTLYHLNQRAKDSFMFTTEMSLKKMGREMEIDIICLVDGELIIGEAKMGKLIKDRDFSPRDEFEKYKKLAKELQADRVVFSTLSEGFYDVPRSKIERFKKELAEEGTGGVEVTILTRQDLLGAD